MLLDWGEGQRAGDDLLVHLSLFSILSGYEKFHLSMKWEEGRKRKGRSIGRRGRKERNNASGKKIFI